MVTETKVKNAVELTYDGAQRCTVVQTSNGRTFGLDCPQTGGGEGLSPGSLVAAGLAGCISLSMGVLAERDNLDITGMKVEVGLAITPQPDAHIGKIAVTVSMPRDFSKTDRMKLERAADACPVKHSFRPETSISTEFRYPS